MFKRDIENTIRDAANAFPVVTITGPRQSGKTTLIKQMFPNHFYINLEFPDELELIKTDPRNIINTHIKTGLIIDEARRYAEIFSYIQGYVDQNPKAGQFILSGSQNFLLADKIAQSLAGRTSIIELLPLTFHEYCSHAKSNSHILLWNYLYNGGYPRPYQENIPINLWYKSYIQTYIERDIRELINIKDLSKFQRFLKLCAARHGQILNVVELSQAADINRATAKQWLSLLQASYVIFFLQPYYKNFNKRLVKMPKLYFYDSAIVCQLLGIESAEHLSLHTASGAIFEGYIICELLKKFHNQNKTPQIYYWRDNSGLEIDCVLEEPTKISAIEIKSSMTYKNDLLKSLKKFSNIASVDFNDFKLIYAGEIKTQQENIQIIPWRDTAKNCL